MNGLQLIDVHAGYGKARVLNGVTLSVGPGELVALLGRNGCGRSTLARAIMGLVPASGELRWQGRSLRLNCMFLSCILKRDCGRSTC